MSNKEEIAYGDFHRHVDNRKRRCITCPEIGGGTAVEMKANH